MSQTVDEQPSAQRQFLVKVSGIDGFFSQKSGGAVSADTEKVWDGGEETPDVIASPPQVEDITVSRAYRPGRDNPIIQQLRQRVGKHRATLSSTPTDADLVANADPTVYSNALLVGLTEPDHDASSGSQARFELRFAVGSFR